MSDGNLVRQTAQDKSFVLPKHIGFLTEMVHVDFDTAYNSLHAERVDLPFPGPPAMQISRPPGQAASTPSSGWELYCGTRDSNKRCDVARVTGGFQHEETLQNSREGVVHGRAAINESYLCPTGPNKPL